MPSGGDDSDRGNGKSGQSSTGNSSSGSSSRGGWGGSSNSAGAGRGSSPGAASTGGYSPAPSASSSSGAGAGRGSSHGADSTGGNAPSFDTGRFGFGGPSEVSSAGAGRGTSPGATSTGGHDPISRSYTQMADTATSRGLMDLTGTKTFDTVGGGYTGSYDKVGAGRGTYAGPSAAGVNNANFSPFSQNRNDPVRSYGLMTGPAPEYSTPMAFDAAKPSNFSNLAASAVSPTGVRASGMPTVSGKPNIEWGNASTDVAAGIVSAATALGIDPVDLATVISYETAGTFNPTKNGPTTRWGQHKGFIQFGQPQAKQHGVDWDNPVATQLGPNGAVVSYMKAAGVTPGMGLLDVYSAVNAGSPGRPNATDANNGGAQGTVADKVNNQMAGHRAKAEALLADYQATPNASGFTPGPTGLAIDKSATEMAATGTTPTPQSSGRVSTATAGAAPTTATAGDVAIDDAGKAVPAERTTGQKMAAGAIDAVVVGVGGLPGTVAQIAASAIFGKSIGDIVVDQMGNSFTLNGDGSLTPHASDGQSFDVGPKISDGERDQIAADEAAKAEDDQKEPVAAVDPVARIMTAYLGHPLDKYIGPSGGLFQQTA